MNLRQIEIFRAIMTTGTTSRAAEVLHISQPSVSKSLADLEHSLAFTLFHRIKGRLHPTAEGQLFFREVEQTFAGLAHLRGAAARIRDFGSGEMRIGCLSALSTNILPRALRLFVDQKPKVAVTFQTLMSSSVRDLVASGQFDLGIVADEIDRTGVEVRDFARFRVMLAMPEDHALAAKSVIHPRDLRGQNFVALSPEDTTRQEAERAFAAAGIRPKLLLETPYSTTVCAMVAAGIGIGLVNPITAEPFLGRGVVLRPFEPALFFRTLLILPPGGGASRHVETFIDVLTRTARKDAPDE